MNSNSIKFTLDVLPDPVEMIRIAPDGFYIRGVKVPVDDQESLTVYNAFKEYLTWAVINRPY